MRTDRSTKILLGIISVLLFLNLLQGIFPAKPAVAQKSNSEIGRYQVSAWAAQSGSYTHHNGYYIIDTTTGKVTDSKAEVHGAKE
jgi:hypothetical protein